MGFTKILCKRFDKRNKGYVTLEDVADTAFTGENICMYIAIFLGSVVCLLVLGLIGEVVRYGLGTRAGRIRFEELVGLPNVVTGFGVLLVIVAILKALYMLWNKIKTTKIAVCKLKENK